MEIIEQRRCAVIESLKVFSAKWKPCILCYLLESSKRYGELYRLIPNISKKMLGQHLRELQKDGLITRQSFPQIPPKVVYTLTAKGRSLQSVFAALESWGLDNFPDTCSISDMLQSHSE